ncbi:D-Ala-D-Ala carboxypeptidase family metallohydrolase [Desulfocurvibacter africanus]|uniref:D-Ala-D-Ala carboxypeptidase family metallohydrolase n=1 Tax=Desulfocurvibacter africanus TaxID=873 RepID=UPI00048652B9|nr:D-Ala-D-Ala carboxypeptidase family metallohydrolase [Desulfocurvibacter africanus]
MKRVQLSPDFYLDEFTRSETAARNGIVVEIPLSSKLFFNVQRLAVTLLQPMRDALGLTTILSGYRPPDLNRLVRGSFMSRHMDALAADLDVAGASPLEVCRWYEQSGLPFDQVIHEFGCWTHVGAALEGAEPRRELLTAWTDPKNGRTRYTPGIHDIKELLA